MILFYHIICHINFYMSIIASSFANLASGLILQFLPFNNPTLSLQVSMFTKDAILGLLNEGKKIKIFSYFFKAKPHVIISNKLESDNKPNPIYQKIEQYIVDKYIQELESCQLVPKRGDIVVSMSHIQGTGKDISDTYNDIKYNVRHVNSSEQIDTNNGKATIKSNSFIIETVNGTFDDIKDYIKFIFELNKLEVKIMRIYQPRINEYKEYTHITWESLYVKSNKHIGNTILNQSLNTELINDIDIFLKSQEWYDTRGVPYKRGYILHGPPGTGKTSVIKAIANTYNLPVFTLDFDIISDNNKLCKLITDINYYHKNTPYILCMEDVDRSKIFDKYGDNKISTECLLNILDGVVEAYGRIVFMTANNLDRIKNCNIKDVNFSKALMRPGRIDKVLEIGYIDKQQAERMIQLYYETDQKLHFDPKSHNVSPAELIQIMQLFPNSVSDMMNFFEQKIIGSVSNDLPVIMESMGLMNNNKQSNNRNIQPLNTHNSRKQSLLKDIRLRKKRIKQFEISNGNMDKYKNQLKKSEEKLKKLNEQEKQQKQKEKQKEKLKKQTEKFKKQKEKEQQKKEKFKNNEKSNDRKRKCSIETNEIFNEETIKLQKLDRMNRYLKRCKHV